MWDGEPLESQQEAIKIPVPRIGNIKHCEKYRGINLLNSDYKI
jgi:hypothetical protein